MGTEKQLLTAAIAAAYLTVAGAAFAAQPTNIEQIRCSNNGKGNGGEIVTGDPVTGCEKFVENTEDDFGPSEFDTDPNPNKP